MSESRSEANGARSGARSEPLLPDTTSDEREIGWGDDLADDDDRDQQLIEDRPPHYEDRD
ncbi:MAG TPA: hypothetical protein VHC43_13360 [Mycobacteriales bacterium]|nr:hypothetical protein [Mycobacteriales bacterium]